MFARDRCRSNVPPAFRRVTTVVLCGLSACADPASSDDGDPSAPTSISVTLSTTDAATTSESGDVETSANATATTTTSADTTTGTPGDPCLFCDAPNQRCEDEMCVTTCHGQAPDPCGPAQVCDVMSGECVDPGAACTLSGPNQPCDAQQCGPGSVCDDQGSCIPIPPCADVACLDTGECWGTSCSCERAIDCTPPTEADLNGPFATEIGGLDFADDCTAWMVTLRSGTDYVRRLTPDGTVTEWGGVSNLNMGEVKVLKAVTPPQGIGHGASVHGLELGEVAITYTCCTTCGCFTDPPQGVARLVPDDVANPLPLVIVSAVTTGTGPFGTPGADSGPFGLTWGIDRVLYVGNSTANGEIVRADLDMRTQSALATLDARITASAPTSAAHLLIATEGGTLYRFNVLTNTATAIAELGTDVTSLSHDAFDGTVYAGLRTLEVVSIDPWSGTVAPFDAMPGRGRVTVSPDGQLWFSPVAYLDPNAIFPWDLADAF
jgi:hypothetical protein